MKHYINENLRFFFFINLDFEQSFPRNLKTSAD